MSASQRNPQQGIIRQPFVRLEYVVSAERTFGTKQTNGSWTGMMGMLMRQEADFGAVPFILSPERAEDTGYTIVLTMDSMRIVGSLGNPEVDPWGFFYPFNQWVWIFLMVTLIMLLTFVQGLGVLASNIYKPRHSKRGFIAVCILLQQSTNMKYDAYWYGEHAVLGMWMMTTLVLMRSYAGNLISLLAVKHIPQPYQSLRDVLDDPAITMIWQKNSANEQYLRSVKSGIYREVSELEDGNRLKFHTQSQFPESLHTLVKPGGQVLVDVDMNVRNLMTNDFSNTGQCNFYVSREKLLPFSVALLSQKSNPLIDGFNKRVMTLTESGLFLYWMQNIPNSTQCRNQSKKILVTTTLSMANIWGMFLLLVCGEICAAFILCGEKAIYNTALRSPNIIK